MRTYNEIYRSLKERFGFDFGTYEAMLTTFGRRIPDMTSEEQLAAAFECESADAVEFLTFRSDDETVLRHFSKSDDDGIRICVACNDCASPDILSALAADRCEEVRRHVAGNQHATKTARNLAKKTNG